MFHFDRKLQQEKVDTSSGDSNPLSGGSAPPDGNASPDNERHTVSTHKMKKMQRHVRHMKALCVIVRSASERNS